MNRLLTLTSAVLLAAATGCSGGSTEPTCGENETLCGSLCVSTNVDPRHCGACDNACVDGQVCTAGTCAVACPAGQTECGGGCFDTATSTDHCGACDNACASGELCVSGACEVTCPTGQEVCDGTCRNLDNDRAHCGACGNACAADELCNAGTCEQVCATSLEVCDGTCLDTRTDRNNCGACGNACGVDEVCVSSACTLTCGGASPHACDGICTNLQNDPQNCGTCGNTCGAGQVCNFGACTGSCSGGLEICGGSCTNPQVDPDNCGACGNACTPDANGQGVCAAGNCATLCLSDYGDCNGDLSTSGTDGCETNLTSTTAHCGACGNACSPPPNATAACVASTCGIGVCEPGFGNCDSNEANGCETDTRMDDLHCGACDNACAAGTGCLNGSCEPFTADSCANPGVLVPGPQTVYWLAENQDYLSPPICGSSQALDGPDLVFSYTATVTGSTTITFNKPASQRWAAIVSAGACGTLTPEVACLSEYTATSLPLNFWVTAGQTYYVYLTDTTSGTAPLDAPLGVDVTETVTSCAPGQGGIVGATTTRVPTGLTSHTENYVAADSDPNGYVYFGSTSTLWRVPKAGGANEDVEAAAGLTTSHLGYTMLIDGQDIYTVESSTSTTKTSGFVWRISADMGATWLAPQDMVSFASSPGDDIIGIAKDGNTFFMITNEGTSSVDTNIWTASADPATAPNAATLVTSFGANAYNNCRGLALDDTYFYTVCRVGTSTTDHPILRIDRTTFAITELGSVPGNITAGEVHAPDANNDGVADVLYVRTNQRETYLVCSPASASPFVAVHVSLSGTSTTSYGLGYDPVANALWAYEDLTTTSSGQHELVRIQ